MQSPGEKLRSQRNVSSTKLYQSALPQSAYYHVCFSTSVSTYGYQKSNRSKSVALQNEFAFP